MQLSLGEVAVILRSSCGAPERIARVYSIDSRSLDPGSLFFAIRGPRFDGHSFVGQAFERGAVGAVVERAFQAHASSSLAPTLIGVEETTGALEQLGLAVRRRWAQRLIAVTGSIGKTTTKELIAALLATRLSVHKSPGNLNNQFGVALSLLALEPTHEVAVIEMAMSGPGEIARLAQMAEPEIGVVTNVAPVHLQFFDSIDSIARAKRQLIENLKQPATAVLNYDDPRVRRFAEGFEGRVVTFGFREGADFHGLRCEAAHDECGLRIGTRFEFQVPGYSGRGYLRLPGRHNVENGLAAIATASLFDVDRTDLLDALCSFRPLHQRNEVLTLANNVTLINDCYNSNPRAMEQMLETLAAWPVGGRRIVVAGEMLELGPSSPEWHHAIGRKCLESRVDWLLAVQGDARFFLEGAVEAGLPAERMRFFEDPDPAGEFLRTLIRPRDVVLVKGSRGVHLEKITEGLESLVEPWKRTHPR